MTQHTAAIVIVAVMAAGVMVTATTTAVAAVKALRDYMKERGKKNETWIDPRSDRSHGRKADPVHRKAGRMNAAAVIAIAAAAFLYVEAAIGTGYYMYLITRKKTKQDATKEERKQLTRYSIIAGVAFPVTFAILFAARAAERK